MCRIQPSIAVGFIISFSSMSYGSSPIHAPFTLLHTPDLAGHKPSPPLPAVGDWLTGTPDDEILPASHNPHGALSHNLADLAGVGGAGFNLAPSLTGDLVFQFTKAGSSAWDLSVKDLAYTGQASPIMTMNQFLVTPGSPAAQDPTFNVDGLGNSGTWHDSAAGNWAISYELDFYFDTSASPNPINATFNNALQTGYLIPVEELTPAGLSGLALADPAGFFAGELADYLLNVVLPLLPSEATFLLFTQMTKTQPVFTEPGLPITTASLIGNTTVAYTTSVIPEPTSLALLALGVPLLTMRYRRNQRREHTGTAT